MKKTDKRDLIYLIKHSVLGFMVLSLLLGFLGVSINEALIVSFACFLAASCFLWFFVHPLVKDRDLSSKEKIK